MYTQSSHCIAIHVHSDFWGLGIGGGGRGGRAQPGEGEGPWPPGDAKDLRILHYVT